MTPFDAGHVVKVMIVDDSAFMRKALTRILSSREDMRVTTVSSGEEALDRLDEIDPDVVTMDVEMPGMGGLESVKALIKRRKLPVIMVSSLTERGTTTTLQALENGAVDFIAKPSSGLMDIGNIATELLSKIDAVVKKEKPHGLSALPPLRMPPPHVTQNVKIECVAIGISTGGPVALSTIMARIPKTFSVPIVIVQHMPVGFTKALAERLDGISPLQVVEAQDGMILAPGKAIVAIAGKQLRLTRAKDRVMVSIRPDVGGSLYIPSVDLLMTSLAESYGAHGLGVIMTGMGNDGVRGVTAIKQAGGTVFAQDEASSVVFGMPRAVISAGLVDRVISLDGMAQAIGDAVHAKSASGASISG